MRSKALAFRGVNDVRAGKLIELDLADGTSDADIEDMCRKLLANTVIENFRIERLETAHEKRGHRLPRLQLRPRPRRRAGAGDRPQAGDGLAQATPSFPTASTSSAFPAAFPTAIICAPARWRRARRSCARSRTRRPRRAGDRHLQRLPGADRSRAAARRADAQCAASASSAAPVPLRVENSQSLFTAHYDAGEDDRLSGRAPRRQLSGRRGRRSTGSKAKAASPSAISTRSTARRAHRRHPQR